MVIAGLILAAGSGRRLGQPKALLELEGLSALDRALALFELPELSELVVVLGAEAGEIRRSHHLDAARVVVNDDWEAGDMLSSLQSGLRALEPDVDHVIVHLVDHPAVSPDTVRALALRTLSTRAPLVRPSAWGRAGHPVVFGREIIEGVMGLPAGSSPREVVSKFFRQSELVAVEDPGIAMDVDVPEDLEGVRRLIGLRQDHRREMVSHAQ